MVRRFGWAGALALIGGACASDGDEGALRVQLAAEETISEGLSVGQAAENTRDFGVTYSKYLVTVGRLKLGRGGETRSDDGVFIADMMRVGAAGLDLVELDDLKPGQWSALGFETPAAAPGARVLSGVSQADADEMIAKKLTYWIEGTVNRPNAPVRFSFQVSVPTVFSDCESDGEPGVAVAEGGRSAATITLHGDHLWFDSFLTASEASVVRRTQWLVDADTDGDGRVVTEDLASVRPEVIFKGYDLAGAPIAISTALDFVRAQLATQGHLNGEGECVWTIAQ